MAALLLAGCAPDFTPRSVVEDLRVLAIVADPPDVLLPASLTGPTETVTLRATAVAPPATAGAPPVTPAPADVRWSFCPFSIGASSGYACAVPACETSLVPEPDGSVRVDPVRLGITCLAALPGGALPGAPSGSGLPAGFEVLVRYVATVGQVQREAVQRIPVKAADTTARNLNPILADPTFTGCTATAGSCPLTDVAIAVEVDPSSFQSYPSGAAGRTSEETIVVSFFTTAGRFKYETGQATSGSPRTDTVLEAKELNGARQALVWLVARDLRGGEAVKGPFTVDFSRP
jgi:hypothetical protein